MAVSVTTISFRLTEHWYQLDDIQSSINIALVSSNLDAPRVNPPELA